MKEWWRSKTIWINLIALAAALIQMRTGLIISGEVQGVILTALNLWLRFHTDEAIGRD